MSLNTIEKLPLQKCTGCGACEAACAVECIRMQYKENGFWYPVVDHGKCVNCGQCALKCPALLKNGERQPIKAFACYAKESQIVEQSSSGGIFTLLAEQVLAEGGTVYGAEFSKDFKEIRHTRITEEEQIVKIRGSKYVQSRMEKIYPLLWQDIKAGRKVLFSGTPCQCAAVKSVYGETEQLIVVDFICHGVPSPMVWKEYLSSLEKHKNGRVTRVQFRNKDWDWFFSQLKVEFGKKKYWESNESGPFLNYFFSDNALRESCYECKYRGESRVSDITMSDYWSVNKEMPDFVNTRGTSYCTVNTEKGLKLWNKILDACIYRETGFEYLRCGHPPVHTASFDNAATICQQNDVYNTVKKMVQKPIKQRVRLALRMKTNLKRAIRKMRLILK